MTHALKELLGNDHPLFAANIVELEKATGGDGVDARLLGDSIERAHEVLRGMGLDPSNTTGPEAYHALNNLSRSNIGLAKLDGTDFEDWFFT